MPLTIPTDAETPVYGRECAHAFGFPEADYPSWFERCGAENLRVCEGGSCGLVYIPMGQFWGGRSVPMTGIAGVVVAPERRGGGTATRMMREAVQDLHARGVPLSALYPATVPLYQRAGYERAGGRYQVELDLRDVPNFRTGDLRRLDGPADEAMRAMYTAYAASRNGYLDRGEYVWNRTFRTQHKRVFGFAVGNEGYVALEHSKDYQGEMRVEVTDFVALTAAGGRRLLGLLADYRSISRTVSWHGGSPDLFLLLLPERRHEIRLTEYWMLRIVDVPAALSLRGYHPVSLALDLEVEDDVVEANCGRWRLSLENGIPHVERGGAGELKLDVRALAMLYSGFLPCCTLVTAGVASGGAESVERASALFAGPAPVTADFF